MATNPKPSYVVFVNANVLGRPELAAVLKHADTNGAFMCASVSDGPHFLHMQVIPPFDKTLTIEIWLPTSCVAAVGGPNVQTKAGFLAPAKNP